MSTLMQIPNLYATKDSKTKFEANYIKNGKVYFFYIYASQDSILVI